jgi:hypothetical protein
MIRATWGDLQPELSRLAGVSGYTINDSRLLIQFNKATQEGMNMGDFPGVVDRFKVRLFGQYLTLPGDLERIMGICIDGRPVEMRAPWFEFTAGGPGPHREGDLWVDWDEDPLATPYEEVATFQPIPEDGNNYSIAVSSDQTESGTPSIVILGYDQNGKWLRSLQNGVMADGLVVNVGSTSSTPISAITAALKPPTVGYITLTATFETTTQVIAIYGPNETRPTYRRYNVGHLIPRLNGNRVLTRCRKRFVPVVNLNDFVIISNLNAMEALMRAVQAREDNDAQGYVTWRQTAKAILTEEAVAYEGRSKAPAISFGRGFSIGEIPWLV